MVIRPGINRTVTRKRRTRVSTSITTSSLRSHRHCSSPHQQDTLFPAAQRQVRSRLVRTITVIAHHTNFCTAAVGYRDLHVPLVLLRQQNCYHYSYCHYRCHSIATTTTTASATFATAWHSTTVPLASCVHGHCQLVCAVRVCVIPPEATTESNCLTYANILALRLLCISTWV